MVETRYEHIVLDDNSVPQVAGANTKVVEIVMDQYAYGWSPEEICYQHPHLSMGQIHSALAYYWDHKDELDTDIKRRLRHVEEMEKQTPVPPFVKKLRQQLGR